MVFVGSPKETQNHIANDDCDDNDNVGDNDDGDDDDDDDDDDGDDGDDDAYIDNDNADLRSTSER